MPTSSDLEIQWHTLVVGLNETEWVNGLQMATGIFVRYLPASSTLYQWSSAGAGSWSKVLTLSTFLAAGAITTVNMTDTI